MPGQTHKQRYELSAAMLRLALAKAIDTLDQIETKYNHNHDDRGRFNFAPGGGRFGGGGAGASWGPASKLTASKPVSYRRTPSSPASPANISASTAQPLRPKNLDTTTNGGKTVAQPHTAPRPRGTALRRSGRQNYELDNNRIVMPPRLQDHANAMGATFQATTGRTMTIVSATRNAQQQADAMYQRRIDGSDGSDYTNHPAFQQIDAAYQAGRRAGHSRAQTVAAMAAVINQQMAQGTHISFHLIGGAIDVRTNDLTLNQRRSLIAAARANGGRPHYEGNRHHAHLHVQFY